MRDCRKPQSLRGSGTLHLDTGAHKHVLDALQETESPVTEFKYLTHLPLGLEAAPNLPSLESSMPDLPDSLPQIIQVLCLWGCSTSLNFYKSPENVRGLQTRMWILVPSTVHKTQWTPLYDGCSNGKIRTQLCLHGAQLHDTAHLLGQSKLLQWRLPSHHTTGA